jgi:hypothetical protein
MSALPPPANETDNNSDGRRTAIALVSATLISVVTLALLAIFDVK